MTLKDAVVTRYARAVRSLAALVIEIAMQGRLETIDSNQELYKIQTHFANFDVRALLVF